MCVKMDVYTQGKHVFKIGKRPYECRLVCLKYVQRVDCIDDLFGGHYGTICIHAFYSIHYVYYNTMLYYVTVVTEYYYIVHP